MRAIGPLCLCAVIGAVAAAQQPPPASPPPLVAVRPIAPPATPLPGEAASAGVTRFSFIAYGDTRSGSVPDVPGDGQIVHVEHTRVVDRMIPLIRDSASTPFPIRFVLHSGDAVPRGQNGAMRNE